MKIAKSKSAQKIQQEMPKTIKEARKLYNIKVKSNVSKDYSNGNKDGTSNTSKSNKDDSNNTDYDNQTIEATPLIAKVIQDLHKLEELKKQLLANEDRLKLEIMNYMQMHSKLLFKGVTIATWKNSTRNSFDLQSFKKQFPDLYVSYLEDINIRSFRLC